jgi:molybdate/tungstate transport system substrate-binding protein
MKARAAHPTLAALLAIVAVAASACGSGGSSSSSSSSGSTGATASSSHGAPVAVIYAGSLAKLMEDDIGPAFQKATGYSFEGFGGGSGEDAKQIKGRVRQGDVFVSASAQADKTLQGSANGNWVSWYSTFATTPLVLGYDPSSRVGRELAHGKPWYEAIVAPGVRVGRTDPKLDPKGLLTVQALEEAARKLGRPALQTAQRSFPVFPETDLVGRLQAGQLDAGFLYAIEADVAHIPTVSLAPIAKTAAYTVTILNRSPHQAGAQAFVRSLLAAGTTLTSNGLTPISPKLSGQAASVPASLAGAVGTAAP